MPAPAWQDATDAADAGRMFVRLLDEPRSDRPGASRPYLYLSAATVNYLADERAADGALPLRVRWYVRPGQLWICAESEGRRVPTRRIVASAALRGRLPAGTNIALRPHADGGLIGDLPRTTRRKKKEPQ